MTELMELLLDWHHWAFEIVSGGVMFGIGAVWHTYWQRGHDRDHHGGLRQIVEPPITAYPTEPLVAELLGCGDLVPPEGHTWTGTHGRLPGRCGPADGCSAYPTEPLVAELLGYGDIVPWSGLDLLARSEGHTWTGAHGRAVGECDPADGCCS